MRYCMHSEYKGYRGSEVGGMGRLMTSRRPLSDWSCSFEETTTVKRFGAVCRSNREIQLAWCGLLHLSKWAELSTSWREVNKCLYRWCTVPLCPVKFCPLTIWVVGNWARRGGGGHERRLSRNPLPVGLFVCLFVYLLFFFVGAHREQFWHRHCIGCGYKKWVGGWVREEAGPRGGGWGGA